MTNDGLTMGIPHSFVFGKCHMKLNIGSGGTIREGYKGCDILPIAGVDYVCPAHKLPFEDGEIDGILAEHLIEHLTYFEFNQALAEWYRVLKPGGELIIECPDLLGVCKAFVEANEYSRYQTNLGHWPLVKHIYGHQTGKTSEEQLSQVHKSGYTQEHLGEVLRGVGFTSFEWQEPVKNTPGSCVMRVRAIKK